MLPTELLDNKNYLDYYALFARYIQMQQNINIIKEFKSSSVTVYRK